jgi:hypothetical protein
MSTEKEYDVIFSADYREFKNCVNFKINNGWELQGGVCVFNVTDPKIYYQAIVKEGVKNVS